MSMLRAFRRSATPALLAAVALLAVACSKPAPPPTDQPPEPQATELNDAIQRPIQRAEQVETQVLDAAQQQRDEIEAQTGG